ncbi:MAG: phytanoyl-CoA dioxygenase family protein [Acidimicrobiales bacterium]
MRQPSVDGLKRRLQANPAYQRTAEWVDGVATIVGRGSDRDLDHLASEIVAGDLDPAAVPHLRQAELHRLRLAYQDAVAARAEWPESLAPVQAGLEVDGVYVLRDHVPAPTLATMVADMNAFVGRMYADGHISDRYQDREGVWADDAAVISNDAFAWSPELVQLAAGTDLLEVARCYLGADPVIQRAQAMHYEPHEPSDRHQFRWHHDLEGRRLKAMILLTDVGAADQPMLYVRRSHRQHHSIHRYRDNRLRPSYARRRSGQVDVTALTGNAGDVILFDSNGLHRGLRRPTGAARDVLVLEYALAGSTLMGGCPDPDAVGALSESGRSAFAPMVDATPVWERKVSAGGWIDQLAVPERWALAYD